jgi:hypothetical protein
MENTPDLPNYTLSAYQRELMQKLSTTIDSKNSGVCYISTGPRQHGTTDALTILLALLLATEPNFRVTILSPYINNSERMLNLICHWLIKMQKIDGVTKTRCKIYKNTSGLYFLSVQDALSVEDAVVHSWNPTVAIITEAEYVDPSAIVRLIRSTTANTNVIVMNYNIENVKYIDELWTAAKGALLDSTGNDDKQEMN